MTPPRLTTLLWTLLAALCLGTTYPRRIVSLSPAMTELVCQLGAADRLVGRTQSCDYPPEIANVTTVGDFAVPDAERILALNPDLLVSNYLTTPQVTRLLEQHHIRCYIKPINTFQDYCDCTAELGDLLGLPANAETELDRVRDCHFPDTGRTALLAIWETPFLLAGDNTFQLEMLRLAGARVPDLNGNQGYFTPAEDWLRTQPLDLLITCQKETSLVGLPFPVQPFPDDDLIMRPGPRWTEAVRQLHELLAGPANAPEPNAANDHANATLTALRLWRLAAAFAVGGILALAGLLFQTLFHNPLATPYTLGTSSGAAAGAACAFVFGSGALLPVLVPSCAFAGAMLTLAVVIYAGSRDREGTDSLLLCGVITGIILSSLLIFVISISNSTQLAGVTWWTLGDLQALPPYGILLLLALLAVGAAVAQWHANSLNALLLGEETAMAMGVRPRALRLTLITLVSLMTATAISLAGIIGFVGLIVPHLVRRLVSANHRHAILPTVLGGGLFLLACDQFARILNPIRQMPVGLVTAIAGGILFLALLRRRKY